MATTLTQHADAPPADFCPRISPQDRRRGWLIAIFLFVTYAFFYHGNGWNQNSHLDLVQAIVQRHTLTIDAYEENTGDKAFWNDHYYSEKAPGVSFTAVPVVAAASPLLRAAGIDPESPVGFRWLRYLATLFAVALPGALACMFIYRIALQMGASAGGSAFAALTLGLATPMWPYSTIFWRHVPTGAFLVFAFAACMAMRTRSAPRQLAWLGLVVGLTAGWATLHEFAAAPASAMLAIFALHQVWNGGRDRSRVLSAAAGITLGALACIGVLVAYQLNTFGSVLNLGYLHHANFEDSLSHGFAGVTYPKWYATWQLLVGSRRGLLRIAPVLALAPLVFVLRFEQRAQRRAALWAAAIAVYLLLLNAAFQDWDGGDTFGPRYLSPGLPFWCLLLALLWTRARSWQRGTLLVLSLWGAVNALISVATTVTPGGELDDPFWDYLWPEFRAGRLDFNVGNVLLHLRGLWSLVPLFVFWAAAIAFCVRLEQRVSAPRLDARDHAASAAHF